MPDAQLDKSANIETIRRLHQDGLLGDDAFIAASSVLRPASAWFAWARRMLLFFGSALVLAGIIFFFAYNWSAMGHFLKFGLIEAGIVVCIIVSHLHGKTRLSGKVLLMSASVLVGVLLAVYGQAYQTGADAFELFLGWAVLIFGWVVISEFAALWIVWLILLNTGAILYWQQVRTIPFAFLCLALAVLNCLILTLREVGVQRKLEWLSGRWLRDILVTATLAALSLPTVILIVKLGDAGGADALVACAWGVAVIGGYICYRYKFRDMIPLAIIVMNMCTMLLILIGRALFSVSGDGIFGLFQLFALIILGVVTGAIFWLRKIAATIADETEKGTP